MIDFKTKTGKINISKLAEFVGKSEGTLRAKKKKDPKEFEIYYFGSLCVANKIKEEDIINLSLSPNSIF